jgi:hypothetical protein
MLKKLKYRKIPLKNPGDIQNTPDSTILVKKHWIFSQELMLFMHRSLGIQGLFKSKNRKSQFSAVFEL